MKRTIIAIVFLMTMGFCFETLAGMNPPGPGGGEQIFIEHADQSLAIIEKTAKKLGVEGAAIVAYIPGKTSETWVSKMKVMGRLADKKANYLAVAYSKAAEMAFTLEPSGKGERKDIIGEFGWQGGVIIKLESGYLLATFSGGSGEQDVEAAKAGLDWLAEKF